MHPDRLVYLARRFAPYRLVVQVLEERSAPLVISGKKVILDCGHSHDVSLHHVYRVGDRDGCSECGVVVVRGMSEFASEFESELCEPHGDGPYQWCKGCGQRLENCGCGW